MFGNDVRCGYVTLPLNNVNDGRCVNASTDPVYNGTIMYADGVGDDGYVQLKTKTVATDLFTVREKTTVYGNIQAYELIVKNLTGPVYMVANEWDFNDSFDYDTSKYVTAPGEMLKAKLLEVGECVILSANHFEGTITVGADVHPVSGKLSA